jgi:hypothetical protein
MYEKFNRQGPKIHGISMAKEDARGNIPYSGGALGKNVGTIRCGRKTEGIFY